MKMLNLGCGGCFHRDWVNLDLNPQDAAVKRHDLAKPLPFDDRSCDVVYHSHVLEHIPRTHGSAFLAECFRVLRPGGVIRVVVPDLERIIQDYQQAVEDLDSNTDAQLAGLRHEWSLIQLLDQCVRTGSGGAYNSFLQQVPPELTEYLEQRTGSEVIAKQAAPQAALRRPDMVCFPSFSTLWKSPRTFRNHIREWLLLRLLGHEYSRLQLGRFRSSGEIHQWMYDRHSLRRLLSEVGFSSCTVKGAHESRVQNWSSYQLDTRANGSIRKPDSLFMEGLRP